MKYGKAPIFLILIISISCIGLLRYHFNIDLNALTPYSELADRISNNAGRQEYYIRNCISNRILGKAGIVLDTVALFEVSDETSPEIGENRKASFQDIFKKKIWISPGEGDNEKQASGNDTSMLLGLPTVRVLKERYINIQLHYSVRKISWCPHLLALA